MELVDVISPALQLTVGAVATFLAILVWSRTREVAWILVVLAVMVTYVGCVLRTLDQFGLFDTAAYEIDGLPIFELVLSNLPSALIAAGFAVLLSKWRFG